MANYRPPIPIRSRRALERIRAKGGLYDFLNYMTTDIVKYEQDFLGLPAATAIGTSGVLTEFTTGGAGTAATVTATPLNGAVALVISSNGSSLFMDNRCFTADQNCTLSCRFTLSAITAVKVEMGFTDSKAAAVIGATGSGSVNSLAATPTLNTGASDATCVIMDTTSGLSSPTRWRMVGAQAGTTKLTTSTVTVTGLAAPVATTYQTITLQLRRVAIASEDVDAEFWVNGVSMGVMRSGANTYNTALNPYIIIYSASAAKTLTLDYFNVYQQRDMTN